MEPEEAVVVPLVPLAATPSTEVMLRMLLDREAMLISRVPAPSSPVSTGLVAPGSGAFMKAVSQAVGQAGRNAPAGDLYRLVLPTGSVARDLVPAVGGGFRGLVRGAGSTKIAGQARLIPAATVGGAATIAAGPLIATVGLAVAGEMLAQHQIQKKLDSIKSAVVDLKVRMDDKDRSVLTTASKQAAKVAAFLLDGAAIPALNSASHAFGELDGLTNEYIDRLDRWLDVVDGYGNSSRIYGPELMRKLVGGRENPSQEFEVMVRQTYEALALRARVVVLEKVAAEASNPDRSLPHVEKVLRNELSVLAERQSQLVGLLDDLNVLQIDSSRMPVAFAGQGILEARTSFGRLSRALHSTPDSLPVLTDSDHTVLELAPVGDGMSVVTPSSS